MGGSLSRTWLIEASTSGVPPEVLGPIHILNRLDVIFCSLLKTLVQGKQPSKLTQDGQRPDL